MRIVFISGSPNVTSINTRLLKTLLTEFALTRQDYEDYVGLFQTCSIIDDVPVYTLATENNSGIPSAIEIMFDALHEFDCFIISVPEHNGSIPAAFKNVLDWLSRINTKVFGGKPVHIISASPGQWGGQESAKALHKIVKALGGEPTWQASIANYPHTTTDELALETLKPLFKDLIEEFSK